MNITLSPSSLQDYELFLKAKSLPRYKLTGRTLEIPDEYAAMLGLSPECPPQTEYIPLPSLFDYQAGIARLAIAKEKFAVFVEPGYGKTLIELEFARHASDNLPQKQCVLLAAPLMVVPQILSEADRFYGGRLSVEQVRAAELSSWLTDGTGRIGITNYQALRDQTPQGRLGALILDESSMLKSQYGKWGTTCIRLGKGLRWKLAGTGTPAPNDRIEYANHAVFLDQFPTVNSFLARFFINRGQTQNRWELKPHALHPFYRALSHWSIFMTNPATYGWKDNCDTIPPIHIHIHDVPLSGEQRELVQTETGTLFGTQAGGITTRSSLSQIAKGNFKGRKIHSNKAPFIRCLVDSWPDESTLIWCLYNKEQDEIEGAFPEAVSIRGDTPHDQRQVMIENFKAGRVKVLISKPEILGFGLNLQVCTRQVFSGLQDSYEDFYQAVKRSNRVGSTKPLNVHIPITTIERPMIETVLDKAHRVAIDAAEQERMFKNDSAI